MPYIDPGATPFDPPSTEHPLGTTLYGYDLLARVLYGIREAFAFGIIVVLIGLAGGSIFGFLAGRLHRYVHSGIIGPMIIFFLFPGLLLAILVLIFFGFNYLTTMLLFGILLIPIFTRIIANAIRRENNYFDITKAIIKYIPLEMAFAIILYQGLGFIGFSGFQISQLGETLEWGSFRILSAPWAMFWPGFFIFLIILGLIFLHEGLQGPTSSRTISEKRTSRRSKKKHVKTIEQKTTQEKSIEQPRDYNSELDT